MNTELISLKGRLPFVLSTTSYIIPDTMINNVLFLGDYVDEVELVFFETPGYTNLATKGEISDLKALSQDFNLTYNIHLPGEVFLGDPSAFKRLQDCDKILRCYEMALSLNPTCFILHLDRRDSKRNFITDTRILLENYRHSLQYLADKGMGLSKVAVENLDYSLSFVSPVVMEFGMTYCLDLGHLLFYRLDLQNEIKDFLGRAGAVHLHGILEGMDHRSLQGIDEEAWAIITKSLLRYSGSVSVEVFSIHDLESSLTRISSSFLSRNRRKL